MPRNTVGRFIHFKELLQLNPNDNQGNRYSLAQPLLQECKNEELGALLKEYEEEASAEWLYTLALWLIRSEGASPRASRTLQEAFDENRLVPIFLLDLQPLPEDPPEYISPGEESEAVAYVFDNGAYWIDTPGAFEWFCRTVQGRDRRAGEARARGGERAQAAASHGALRVNLSALSRSESSPRHERAAQQPPVTRCARRDSLRVRFQCSLSPVWLPRP